MRKIVSGCKRTLLRTSELEVNVFCAVKPQRKMLPVFNIKKKKKPLKQSN